jgi:hypothetical protein
MSSHIFVNFSFSLHLFILRLLLHRQLFYKLFHNCRATFSSGSYAIGLSYYNLNAEEEKKFYILHVQVDYLFM